MGPLALRPAAEIDKGRTVEPRGDVANLILHPLIL